MKKRIFILISAMTLAIGAATKIGAIDLNRPGGEHDYPHAPSSSVAGEQEQKHEKNQKYTCPMHPEVVTEHPGDCPKCGMKLVPIAQQKRSTPDTQHPTSNNNHVPHQSHSSHLSAAALAKEDEMHQHPSAHGGHEMQMEMRSSIDLADPMSREGSGSRPFAAHRIGKVDGRMHCHMHVVAFMRRRMHLVLMH